MLVHDAAYRLRMIRRAVYNGYSLGEALLRHTQESDGEALNVAVRRYLMEAGTLASSDLEIAQAAYESAVRHGNYSDTGGTR